MKEKCPGWPPFSFTELAGRKSAAILLHGAARQEIRSHFTSRSCQVGNQPPFYFTELPCRKSAAIFLHGAGRWDISRHFPSRSWQVGYQPSFFFTELADGKLAVIFLHGAARWEIRNILVFALDQFKSENINTGVFMYKYFNLILYLTH